MDSYNNYATKTDSLVYNNYATKTVTKINDSSISILLSIVLVLHGYHARGCVTCHALLPDRDSLLGGSPLSSATAQPISGRTARLV